MNAWHAMMQALLQGTQWLEELSSLIAPNNTKKNPGVNLQSWARRRIAHVHDELKVARLNVDPGLAEFLRRCAHTILKLGLFRRTGMWRVR
jgi:hypothetical protein